MQTRFIPISVIEREARNTLEGFLGKDIELAEPPIDVDELLVYLNLRLEMDDLVEKYNLPGFLGELVAHTQTVWVDSSLDTHNHPEKLGRYRFTVAHECGHWVLHRYLLEGESPGQMKLDFGMEPDICSSSGTSDEYAWRETQANRFAASLLMPEPLFKKHYFELFHKGFKEIESLQAVLQKQTKLDHLCARFQVSRQAAEYRISDLKLSTSLPLLTAI